MTKEKCTICDEETGRAGISEDSLYPELAGNYFTLKKGDIEGPLCETCYEAFVRVELVK